MTEECDDSKVLAFCFKCSPTPLLYANIYFQVIVFNVVGFFLCHWHLPLGDCFLPDSRKMLSKLDLFWLMIIPEART